MNYFPFSGYLTIRTGPARKRLANGSAKRDSAAVIQSLNGYKIEILSEKAVLVASNFTKSPPALSIKL